MTPRERDARLDLDLDASPTWVLKDEVDALRDGIAALQVELAETKSAVYSISLILIVALAAGAAAWFTR